jgi:hypothetical protein
MTCNTCRKIVYVNNTGICIGCQIHSTEPQADEFKESYQQKLENRVKEIEDALQKQETKSMDACEQTNHGQRMGKGNSKRKKTTS